MSNNNEWAEALIHELQKQGWDAHHLKTLKKVAPIFFQRAMEDASRDIRTKYVAVIGALPPLDLIKEMADHILDQDWNVRTLEKEGSSVDIGERLQILHSRCQAQDV